MASFSAELRVAGHAFTLTHCAFGVEQATHQRGRVSTKVRYGPVQLVLDVPDGELLLAWAAAPQKRQPAEILFRNAAGGQVLETLRLSAAYCVSYHERFVSGDAQGGAYQCHVTLSDPDGWTLTAGGPVAAFVAPAARDHGVPPVPAALVAAAKAAVAIGGKQKAATDDDLVAGTPEHKAARWASYQAKHKDNPKAWAEDRWSKQYDTNMRNAVEGLKREREYTFAMGGVSKTLKTIHTLRQVDIFIEDADYCGQLKTGKVGLSRQAKIDLLKDKNLIDNDLTVEYILEKGGSKPLLAALKKIGASVKIGPQIP